MRTTIQPVATPQRSRRPDPQPAVKSGTFAIGGDLRVRRLGFGAMQLTGPGVWGEPTDRAEVGVAEIKAARRIVPIATVQNQYNLVYRNSADVLDYCTHEKIGFIPWFPLATGDLAKRGGALARVAKRLDAKPAQVALAWLLKKSPVMLPIPGTSKVKHLEENAAAALIELDDSNMEELEKHSAASS